MLQSAKPALHMPITHVPVEHVAAAFANEHTCPHIPQFVVLDRVSDSHAFAGL
jgi:hypothetical protein